MSSLRPRPRPCLTFPHARITLLCATGLHRASTLAEKTAKLGADIVARYRIVDHDAQQDVVSLGQSEHGIPLTVNRLAAAADLLLATGVVEPHQYAGFSGGSKTVAVGVAGEPTIAYTHGPARSGRCALGQSARQPVSGGGA